MTELEEKGLKFYLRHVGVVASDEDFEAWYMQRHLGGRVWIKVCHFCRSRAGSTRGEIDDSGDFWHSSVRCILPSWMCLPTGRADQVQRLLDSLASHHRHQARTAALIILRTGVRVSESWISNPNQVLVA